MKKSVKTMMLSFLVILAASPHAYADGYFKNMGQKLVRGVTNIATCWLEIPVTVQEYHELPGKPVIRHLAGFYDGLFQTMTRAGSGAWDIVAAVLPSHQEGMPVDPETLFDGL